MSTFYIGVDPSITNPGIVVMSKELERISWFEPTKEIPKKELKHIVLRYVRIADKLLDHLNRLIFFFKPEKFIICYENYSFASTNKSYSLGEMGGVLKTTLLNTYVPTELYLVPPNTLKSFATGYGGATKQMIGTQFKIEEPTYPQVTSDDLIDAYYLYRMGLALDGGNVTSEDKLLRHRLTVVNKYKQTNKPILNY